MPAKLAREPRLPPLLDTLSGASLELTVYSLGRLKAIHLNDTKNPFASHKDRHEKLGQGFLGEDALVKIVNHPKLRKLPFYLETPNELDGYAKEIALLKKRRLK